MADTESSHQLNIALRYAGTSLGTLFTVFGLLQFVTPEQVAELTQAVHDFNQSVLSAYGALTKMWVILGPALMFVLARLGIKSGSIQAMIGNITKIATGAAGPEAVEAQSAVITATNTIALDKTIPKSVEAKAVLLDAVAAQPEVVSDIIVTDPALEAATQSMQVKALK